MQGSGSGVRGAGWLVVRWSGGWAQGFKVGKLSIYVCVSICRYLTSPNVLEQIIESNDIIDAPQIYSARARLLVLMCCACSQFDTHVYTSG